MMFKMAGFECEFVEKPPKAVQFECPICLLILREPYQATCCGKSFCKECICQIKAANEPCPTCKDRNFNLFHNKGLQQSLYNFRVYCTHKSKGCEWTGELRELDNHLNSDPPADMFLQGCPYALIRCPLSCAECVSGLYRKDIKCHIDDKLLSHVMMQNARINILEQQLQEYSNTNTQFKLQLEESKEHLEQCIAELRNKVSQLDVKNSKLKSEIEVLMLKSAEIISKGLSDQPTPKQQPIMHVTGTYKPTGAEFTMTDFEEYKREDDMWYSPHFFTYPNGYKMCLRVFANGHGPGKGTHFSVYVCLMQGEFDDQLKWPFRGNITVKLLNQGEDKDHAVKTAHFTRSAPEEACKRVMTEERPGSGQGFSRFLPLTELQPKYLRNNCIKLCIKKVEIF